MTKVFHSRIGDYGVYVTKGLGRNLNTPIIQPWITILLLLQWMGLVWLNPTPRVIALGAGGLLIAGVAIYKKIDSPVGGIAGLFSGLAISQASFSPILSLSLLATGAVMYSRSRKTLYSAPIALSCAVVSILLLWPAQFAWYPPDLITSVGMSSLLALILVTVADRTKLARAAKRADAEHRDHKRQSDRLIDQFEAYLPPQPTKAFHSGKVREEIRHRRRNLMIFFSDIHGFTDRVEEMEPEDVAEFLNDYLTHMCEIVAFHGGSVDKFIGDSLMVIFGDDADSDPIDNAKRCLRMALDMQKRITLLEQHWSERNQTATLKVRMGISSGYCTTGNFGAPTRLEYTAIGKQVNLASRLENLANPGQILCSYPVWKMAHDEFFFEPAGEVEVKGFARPVAIFSAQGEALAPKIESAKPSVTDATGG